MADWSTLFFPNLHEEQRLFNKFTKENGMEVTAKKHQDGYCLVLSDGRIFKSHQDFLVNFTSYTPTELPQKRVRKTLRPFQEKLGR